MKNRHDRAYARNSSIDFKGIAAAALASAKSLLQEWLPGGRFEGHEYVALNPTRNDRSPGSFKINWQTGKWSDFLWSKMRSLRAFVQPPSDPRPGPSGQPRPPNPWTGWTPNPVLQGLGDRHDILQGPGDRHDVGPVRSRPLIAVPETAAVILGRSGVSLTSLAPTVFADSIDHMGPTT